MDHDERLRSLLLRMRQGDAEAFNELYAHYHSELARFIRIRLLDGKVGRYLSESDIFQSVFVRLYVKVIAGQYILETPEDLERLLRRMIGNRIIDAKRKKIDGETVGNGEALLQGMENGTAEAPERLANQDFAQWVLDQMTEEERTISVMRCDGHSWESIGNAIGKSAEAARKTLHRAVERITKQLEP